MARQDCPYCTKDLVDLKGLKRHIKAQHPELYDEYNSKRKTSQPKVEPLDLHIIPNQEDPWDPIVKTEDEDYLVKQYLKERDNRYNHKDFLKYEAKMKSRKKTRDKKPYQRPDDMPGPSNAIDELEEFKQEQKFQCDMCKLQLKSQLELEDHKDAKHPQCEECGERSLNHDRANEHHEIFHGPSKNPIICQLCGESFYRLIEYDRHQAEHPQCPECNQRFLTRAELASHRKDHNVPASKRKRIDSLVCELCNKVFKSEAEILRHKKRKHSFKCASCSLAFTVRKELKDHEIEHSVEQSLQVVPSGSLDVALPTDKSLVPLSDDSQATVDYEKSLVPRIRDIASRDRDSMTDDSEATDDYEKSIVPRIRDIASRDRDSMSDDSEATVDNERSVVPRIRDIATRDSDDSESTVDYEKSVVPRIRDIASRDSDDSESTVGYERNQPRIMDKDDSDDSEVSFDKERAIVPRIRDIASRDSDDSEATVDYERGLVPMSDTSSGDSQATMEYVSSVDRIKTEQALPDYHSDTSLEDIDEEPLSIKQSLPRIDFDTEMLESPIPVSQMVKCPICYKKFSNTEIDYHMKSKHKKNKQPLKKCDLCGERTDNMLRHYKSKHNFSCRICKKRFEFQSELAEHISIEHPTCDKCNKSFSTKGQLIKHQREHPEEKFRVPSEDEEEEEDDLDSQISEGEAILKREDMDFNSHINCMTIEQFLEIRKLINENDFKTLSRDKDLLEALGILMRGVKRGFIPICSSQRLALTNSQKELLYRLARKPSGRLVMKERRDLSLLFETLWASVKFVSEAFANLD